MADGSGGAGRAPLGLGAVVIDWERQEVRRPDGPATALTANELRLLGVLAARAGQTVPSADLLAEALGIRPDLATRALANAVRRLRVKIEEDPNNPRFLKTVYGFGYRLDLPAAPPAALRPASEGFVGRQGELAALGAALTAGALVTVLGPAGVGKTTLVRQLLRSEPGALFVELDAARDEGALARAVAGALGVSLHRAGDARGALERLGRALAERGDALVALDNAEQVLAPTAAAVALWRQAAPRLRLVVTSREPLNVEGEARLPLDCLPVDDAVALFQARAPHLAAAAPLAAVVEALDRLPLAIELAAAHCGTLTLGQVQERLGQRFALLRSRRRDLPARQATLWAAIAWSWDLLAAPDAEALARCAVFASPFGLQDAAHVLGEERDALEAVQALIERSLLAMDRPNPDEEARFRMLQGVREFALAQLSAAEGAAARRRHADWFLAEGERHAVAVHRGGGAAALAALARIEAELLAVHRRHLARDPERAARAALALDALWLVRTSPAEHRALLEETLAALPAGSPRRPWLHGALAMLGLHRIDLDLTASALEAGLAEAGSDYRCAGMLHRYAGSLRLHRGDRAGAARAFEQARALAVARGDAWQEGMVLGEMVRLAADEGRLDEAERLALRARPLLRRSGHRQGESCLWAQLARVHALRGEPGESLRCREEELALCRGLGDGPSVAHALVHLASLQLSPYEPEAALAALREPRPPRATFDPARAQASLREALALLRGEEQPRLEAFVRINLATAALLQGDGPSADEALAALDATLPELPAAHLLDWLLRVMQAVRAARRGEPDRARAALRRARLLITEQAPAGGDLILEMTAAYVVHLRDPDALRAALARTPADAARGSEVVQLLLDLEAIRAQGE